jgi:predicted porin
MGSPTVTWNRRATASLMGDFGELRLGRDYTPTFWTHTQFDPFGTNGVGNANNLIGTGGTTSGTATTRILGVPSTATGDARTGTHVRSDNSIGYHLPGNLGGLYGQAMISAGEGLIGNKYQGARLGYAAGPLNFAVAFGQTDLVTDKLKAFNVGFSFNAGFATIITAYHNYKVGGGELASASSYGNPSNRKLTNFLIGTTVPMGAGTFKASFAKTKGDLNSGNAATAVTAKGASATQFALGYVHDLSKRTSVYTAYSSIKNKKGAHFYTSGSGPAYGNVSTATTPGADFTSSGYEVGFKHTF